MADEGGAERPGGPLVGRGSALRVAGTGDEAKRERAPAGPPDDRRDRRWVPRPSLTRAPRDRRWRDAGTGTTRTRLALGLALLVALAAAWVWVSQRAPASGPSAVNTATTRAAPEPPGERIVAVPDWVPSAIAATCTARAGDEPERVVVDCTPGRGVVSLQYRDFASAAALHAAYDEVSPRRGGDGPARCARGAPEERSWSVAPTPAEPDGRYRCVVVAGTARLVWSNELPRVLASASRADGDLRSLYEWWTSVPGPTGR